MNMNNFVLFGVLFSGVFSSMDPYPGTPPIRTESVDDTEYEELPWRRANLSWRRMPTYFPARTFVDLHVLIRNVLCYSQNSYIDSLNGILIIVA
ncbi:hypothetical protein LOK49_Contig712G00002 [Camellia lanceoleosa]|nr:hypothetical protein LOK49_Contig712G00002 [Camellia lanceoleosa]